MTNLNHSNIYPSPSPSTSTICKHLLLAAEESLQGTTKSPTGAVLLRKGSSTLAGSSTWERQAFAGKVFCLSGHAEISALLSTRHARRLLPTLLSCYGLPQCPENVIGKVSALGKREKRVQPSKNHKNKKAQFGAATKVVAVSAAA